MNQSIIERLATNLHAQYCTLSHEDQCSWYRDNQWSEQCKERWRKQAIKFLDGLWD